MLGAGLCTALDWGSAMTPGPKPCPFCGHEADAGRVGYTNKFAVTCSNDDCPVETQATGCTLEEAIKFWNTRHEG